MKRFLTICVLLFAFAVQAGAQNKQQPAITVNGQVVDSNDMPIVGATVYIKDEPGTGNITNSEGRFTLKAKLYNTLVVSFVGYETVEQILTSDDDVKITLKEGNELEEVVVVGMGTQRKVSVTGAVAVVDTKDLELPATNIVNTLGGRVPGVISVQSSGEPGRNISEFWVRGIGTFGANSGALVLIDGLEGNLSQIDPADVESFSVLKDAAATAVYGSRGANGVVLVTTKRGKEEQLKITFRSNYTISELRRLPKYVNAIQYAEMANEAAAADGLSPIYDNTQMDIIRYGLDPRPLSRHRLAGRDPQPHVVPAHAVRQRAGRRQRRTLLRQPGHVAGEPRPTRPSTTANTARASATTPITSAPTSTSTSRKRRRSIWAPRASCR